MNQFLAIAFAHFLALLSPGQDFVLIVRNSIRGGFKAGIVTSLGIAVANAVWIAAASIGVQRLENIAGLMICLKTGGAILLIYVGQHFIRSAHSAIQVLEASAENLVKVKSPFRFGFLSGLSNPKNMLFYIGLFSLLSSEENNKRLTLFYGLWMTGVVFFWNMLLARTFALSRQHQWFSRRQVFIERCAGLLLILIGLFMLAKVIISIAPIKAAL